MFEQKKLGLSWNKIMKYAQAVKVLKHFCETNSLDVSSNSNVLQKFKNMLVVTRGND